MRQGNQSKKYGRMRGRMGVYLAVLNGNTIYILNVEVSKAIHSKSLSRA